VKPTLLLLALLAAPAAASPILGDKAPALDLQTLDGKTVATKDFAGKVLVVEFFGTWCGFCERAAADLDAVHK
jgi:thiol-disulfide isomerase/thioredoxin